MPRNPQFRVPSEPLALGRLLRQVRRNLWLAFGLALLVHLGFSQLRGFEERQGVAKPLTTQFVKRQPRLTKPLELKKRPAPRRRPLQRRMIAVKARAERRDATSRFEPTRIIRGLTRPSASVARAALVDDFAVEPQTLAGAVGSSMRAKQTMDVSLELLDVEALDTGQYHALVVQDPSDRKNIRGFCRLGVIYSDNMYGQVHPGFENLIRPAFLRLVDAMNRYTDIKTDIFGKITLESEDLLKTPWVYFMAFFGFELSDGELQGMGQYMTTGGFVFADTYWIHPQWRAGFQGSVTTITRALEMRGTKDPALEVLPDSHPVYHCYFDFEGPPTGAGSGGKYEDEPAYLEGIEVDGRLCVILSKKAYYGPWSHFGTDKFGGSYKHLDPTRALQFGVNLIIFALTQEGSITNRVMDVVGH